ncbi:MAG: methylated-DNA-[protein]-cysteine S-methyltransferase [Thermoleophilaceae bacterium]|nr:methylated-DNA-[protein]-cysteine S-methyltransferase [Thermoleophilaceae bacterium]
MSHALIDSPLGVVLVTGTRDALTGLWFADRRSPPRGSRRDAAAFAAVREQLDAYWAGELRDFDLPLAPAGTPFQRTVWDALVELPYGTTLGYGELAARLGRPHAARAVGAANGQNPISVIVPCHRLVGAGGALTGYGGGIERKRWLVAHEHGNAAAHVSALAGVL